MLFSLLVFFLLEEPLIGLCLMEWNTVNPDYNPLTDPTPTEVPLKNAPLVRVVAQVRFPLITAIGDQQFIAPFQEALRKIYPVLRPERIQGVIFGPEGAIPTQEEQVWRFFDVEDHWRISLAPDFVAVETTKYQSETRAISFVCRQAPAELVFIGLVSS